MLFSLLVFLFLVVVGYAIIFGFLALAGLFVCSMVAFSRITFSAVVALILNANNPILEGGGFWSFAIWAGIVFAIVFLLCQMPRFNCSFTFLCYTLVSFFVGTIAVEIGASLFTTLATYKTAAHIIVRIGCILLAIRQLCVTREKAPKDLFGNRFLINVERAFASLVYGFSVWFVLLSTANTNSFVTLAVWLGGAAVAFVIDWIFNKDDLEIPTAAGTAASDVLVGEIIDVLN